MFPSWYCEVDGWSSPQLKSSWAADSIVRTFVGWFVQRSTNSALARFRGKKFQFFFEEEEFLTFITILVVTLDRATAAFRKSGRSSSSRPGDESCVQWTSISSNGSFGVIADRSSRWPETCSKTRGLLTETGTAAILAVHFCVCRKNNRREHCEKRTNSCETFRAHSRTQVFFPAAHVARWCRFAATLRCRPRRPESRS